MTPPSEGHFVGDPGASAGCPPGDRGGAAPQPLLLLPLQSPLGCGNEGCRAALEGWLRVTVTAGSQRAFPSEISLPSSTAGSSPPEGSPASPGWLLSRSLLQSETPFPRGCGAEGTGGASQVGMSRGEDKNRRWGCEGSLEESRAPRAPPARLCPVPGAPCGCPCPAGPRPEPRGARPPFSPDQGPQRAAPPTAGCCRSTRGREPLGPQRKEGGCRNRGSLPHSPPRGGQESQTLPRPSHPRAPLRDHHLPTLPL